MTSPEPTPISSPAPTYPNNFTHYWGHNTEVVISSSANRKKIGPYFAYETPDNTAYIFDPATVGDEVEFRYPLEAGNYRLDCRGATNTTHGIIAIALNDAIIGNMDWYGGLAFGATRSLNFTVTTGGEQIFRVRRSGQNPAAGGNQSLLYSFKTVKV